jgi:GntR family transcriptional regulator
MHLTFAVTPGVSDLPGILTRYFSQDTALKSPAMSEPNRFATRPLYLQLRDALIERIAVGQWKPGTIVPNEGDLAREFGVSPGTMRKALDLMEAMRLLTRRQGRGTFVNDPASRELAARYSNIRTSDGAGIAGEVVTGEVSEGSSNELECARLQLAKGDRVYRLQRRHVHDGRAYMIEDVSMPTALFPGLTDDTQPSPSITALASRNGVLLGKAEEQLSIGEAAQDIAAALEIPVRSPILVLDRVVFGLSGPPVEWRMAWCHLNDRHYLAEMN